jgi:hypothetical protein
MSNEPAPSAGDMNLYVIDCARSSQQGLRWIFRSKARVYPISSSYHICSTFPPTSSPRAIIILSPAHLGYSPTALDKQFTITPTELEFSFNLSWWQTLRTSCQGFCNTVSSSRALNFLIKWPWTVFRQLHQNHAEHVVNYPKIGARHHLSFEEWPPRQWPCYWMAMARKHRYSRAARMIKQALSIEGCGNQR